MPGHYASMNTCSVEVLSHIIELACAYDFGQTARNVGLVSKLFRAIAEPIELQTIAVSGIKQVEGACERLSSVEGSGEKSIEVRHLFISELTMEHALAAETNYWNGKGIERSSFWLTKEGGKAKRFYLAHTERFWTLVSTLVKKTSPTLRTLFLLACENWLVATGREMYPKVLGILSDATFPSLLSLAVHHNVMLDAWGLRDAHTKFIVPEAPSLRKLHIMSSIVLITPGERMHPLLEGPLQSPKSELTDLVIEYSGVPTRVEEVMQGVFAEKWNAESHSRTLPGKLQSVIFQQGVLPREFSFAERAQHFVAAVEELHIDGLEAQLPMPQFPEEGKRRYELLLAEWKERCLESF